MEANEEVKGNEGEGNEGEAPKFTQEDVNRMLADHKRALKKENEELSRKFEATSTEVQQLKQVLEAAARDAGMKLGENGFEDEEDSRDSRGGSDLSDMLNELTPPKGVSRELWMQVQGIKHGYGKQINELSGTIENQSKQLQELLEANKREMELRQQADNAAKEATKINLLQSALARANCTDIEGGRRYLKDQVVWHQGEWKFKPQGWRDDDDYISVEKGVAKELPPYLVKSAINNGGAGSNGSSGGNAARLSELEANTAALETRARSTRNDRDLAQYMKAKRELLEYKKNYNPGSV